jgi:hypothetical protein
MREGQRERTRGTRTTIARSVAVYVAIMAGAAAIGALVGALIWGEWFIGAGLAVCIAAWLAFPTGMLEARGKMLSTRTRRCVLVVPSTVATREVSRRSRRR